MEKITLTVKNFIKKNPLEFWFLLGILVIGAFCRLYKIDQYMTFLGDEGRDVIIVRRFLTELHPPLIGPGTSVGNMYLGPLYYYMMAPALFIANYSPVGPAVEVAVLGVLTIFLVWFIAREWFPPSQTNTKYHTAWGALIAAGLYSISPVVIIFSRSSWNPNIMPFFALISIYSVWKVWKEKRFGWLIVLGISFAFVLQSHYLGLLLIPVLFLYWFLTLKDLKPSGGGKSEIANFVKKSLLGLGIFAIMMSPLLIFDIRHGWINTKAIESFIVSRKDIGFSMNAYLSKIGSVSLMISSHLISAKNLFLGILTLGIILLSVIPTVIKNEIKKPMGLVSLWLITGAIGISFYKGLIFDHYLGFLFPAPFLLVGGIVQKIRENKIWVSAFGIYLLAILIVNVINLPVFSNPTFQMQRAISVAKVIQEKADGQKFNLATISDFNNRSVYQYFLMLWGDNMVDTDPSTMQFTVTDQLFVVCELPKEKCDPVHNPSAWITSFGWTKIVDEWEVWGGTLFKLGHNK